MLEWSPVMNYRGADKFLAKPGRKQANVCVRMAWISFGALPCSKSNLMTAHVSMLLKSRGSLTCFQACFLPGRAKDLSAPRYIVLLYLITIDFRFRPHLRVVGRVRYVNRTNDTQLNLPTGSCQINEWPYTFTRTALQAGRWRVQFSTVSLEFFIDIILPAALQPWGRLSP